MTRFARDPLCRRHRFPAEVIAHALWLYFLFPLSLRITAEKSQSGRGISAAIQMWSEIAQSKSPDHIRTLT